MSASGGIVAPATPPPDPIPSGPSALFFRKGRVPLYVGAVIAVAIVVLILVLVLPAAFGPGSGSSSPNALSYDQARPIAQETVANFQGGGWTILFASGYAVNESYSASINATFSEVAGSYCTFTPVPGLSGNLTLPGIVGNLTSGVASGWVFAFQNGAGNVSLVAVLGGQGTVLGTLSGTFCGTIFRMLSPVPGNVIDSTAAAQAVSVPSSAFRAAHPNSSALFTVIGGVSSLLLGSVGPEWMVDYSTCTPSTPTGTPGYTFNATVGALNGTLLSTPTTSPVVCSGVTSGPPTPLGTALSVFLTGQISSGTAYLYNFTVASAGGGVTWQDTIPEITGPGGAPIGASIPWNLTVTTVLGAPVASFSAATAMWTGSPGQLIVAGEALTLGSLDSLSGDSLVLQGTGAFSGTITVAL